MCNCVSNSLIASQTITLQAQNQFDVKIITMNKNIKSNKNMSSKKSYLANQAKECYVNILGWV